VAGVESEEGGVLLLTDPDDTLARLDAPPAGGSIVEVGPAPVGRRVLTGDFEGSLEERAEESIDSMALGPAGPLAEDREEDGEDRIGPALPPDLSLTELRFI